MVESDAAFPLRASDDQLRRALLFAGELRTGCAVARGAFGHAVESILGHRADAADHLEEALAADPGLAAAHLVRGFAVRILGRRDLFPGIRTSLAAARESFAERGAGEREQVLHDALSDWLEGRAFAAADRLDVWLGQHPGDLLVIKLAHALRFIFGDAPGMRRSVEAVLGGFGDEEPGAGYVHGCHAFTLEETGDRRRAEAVGRHGLALEPRDVWGLHAVAHVYYEEGRMRDGAAWLAGRDELLDGVNNFAGHLAWHEALFHVELGRPGRALDLYDRRIDVYPPRDYRDVSNASTLLLLLQRAGLEVGDRWRRLAEIARERKGDHGLSFADLHYLLALLGAGARDEADGYLESMRRAAHERDGFDALVAREVGVPLGEAFVAAFAGRHAAAHAAVRALGAEVRRIGGSRAQRRVVPWALAATEVGGRSAEA
ncbi:MAG: tetratricopeptide repeat protein [Planctomycetota bacterium]